MSKVFFSILLAVIFGAVAFVLTKRNYQVKNAKVTDVLEELKRAAKRENFNFAAIQLTRDNNLEAVFNGVSVTFSSTKGIASQLASLQKIIKSSKIENKVNTVDFRFNKIILTYD